MSLAEIEAELGNLSTAQLRRLALKSWSAFLDKESAAGRPLECSEEDPQLLAALDEALASAKATPGLGLTATEIRRRVREWTSR